MYNNILTLTAVEDIDLQTIAGRCFERLFEESFCVQGKLLGREILKAAVESIELDEAIGKSAEKPLTEQIITADLPIKVTEKAFTDSFELQDDANRAMEKVITEDVVVNEEFKRFVQFFREMSEAVCVVDGIEKMFNKYREEQFSLSEGVAKSGKKNITTPVKISEKLERKAVFRRVFEESVSAIERLSKKYNKSISEVMKIVDAYLRSANAAYSDFYISNKDLSYEEFLKINSPVGYESFRDFLIGDYEYKEALFRVMLNGPLTEGRPLITNWALNVDVPDICDRGTLTVPKEGKRINFGKRFYEIPEVNVIVRAGANGVPDYTVDDTGFFVKIYGPDGQPISATISWSAIGY